MNEKVQKVIKLQYTLLLRPLMSLMAEKLVNFGIKQMEAGGFWIKQVRQS